MSTPGRRQSGGDWCAGCQPVVEFWPQKHKKQLVDRGRRRWYNGKKGGSSMSMAEKIKAGRQALGITQQQLAAALGVSPQAVHKWERGGSLR